MLPIQTGDCLHHRSAQAHRNATSRHCDHVTSRYAKNPHHTFKMFKIRLGILKDLTGWILTIILNNIAVRNIRPIWNTRYGKHTVLSVQLNLIFLFTYKKICYNSSTNTARKNLKLSQNLNSFWRNYIKDTFWPTTLVQNEHKMDYYWELACERDVNL